MKIYKFYTIYRVTNKMTGQYYIGAHRTNDLNDGYMGSGKYIKRAIHKYGVDKFIKEIIHVYDNEFDMLEKEAEIVNEGVVKDSNSYNLARGGSSPHGNQKWTMESKTKLSNSKIGKKYVHNIKTLKMKLVDKDLVDEYIKAGWIVGRLPLSQEARKKISKANKGIKRSPEFNKRNSENRLKEWKDPEYREKKKIAREKYLNDPNRKKYVPTIEAREKSSKANKGKGSFRTPEGIVIKTSVDDPRVLSGELVGVSAGKTWVYHPGTGETHQSSKEELNGYLSSGFVGGRGKLNFKGKQE